MVSPDHPRVPLLFAIEWELTDEVADAMASFVDDVVRSREWTITIPRFVDELDDSSGADPDDEPIRTIGLAAEVLSGFPPWGDRIPVDVDRVEWDDVSLLVQKFADFSRQQNVEIVVEFDGEAIGWIKNGSVDSGLTETLLCEWRRSIDARHDEPTQ